MADSCNGLFSMSIPEAMRQVFAMAISSSVSRAGGNFDGDSEAGGFRIPGRINGGYRIDETGILFYANDESGRASCVDLVRTMGTLFGIGDDVVSAAISKLPAQPIPSTITKGSGPDISSRTVSGPAPGSSQAVQGSAGLSTPSSSGWKVAVGVGVAVAVAAIGFALWKTL